jgi:WD40 repeat protein
VDFVAVFSQGACRSCLLCAEVVAGKEIVSCSGDGTVKVLSSRLHSLATLLVPLNRRALCVAMIARHTRYVAVGSSDATVHLFELSV